MEMVLKYNKSFEQTPEREAALRERGGGAAQFKRYKLKKIHGLQ